MHNISVHVMHVTFIAPGKFLYNTVSLTYSVYAGLEMATDTVANATKIVHLATSFKLKQ